MDDGYKKIKEDNIDRIAQFAKWFEEGEISQLAYDELVRLSNRLKMEEEAHYWTGAHSGN